MAEYIEREAALAAIVAAEKDEDFNTRDVLSGLYIAEDAIKNAPAADVEPVKHGRWQTHIGLGWLWRCSCCKYELLRGPWKKISHNYCPACGAKMDA